MEQRRHFFRIWNEEKTKKELLSQQTTFSMRYGPTIFIFIYIATSRIHRYVKNEETKRKRDDKDEKT